MCQGDLEVITKKKKKKKQGPCEAPSGVVPDIQRRLYVLYLMVSL